MLQVTGGDVLASPFPHVVSDAILPPSLFEKLKEDYPDSTLFEATATATAGIGSRAGKNTGFDIYRGDPAYAALTERSSAWAEFDLYINSSAFVEKYLELFDPFAKDIGIHADIARISYDRGYIEPRETLQDGRTFGDRLGRMVKQMVREPRHEPQDVKLFTRLDITRSMGGYAKPPHCDRGNRLCSLIIYFTDADEAGLEGGELQIYQLRSPVPVDRAPRHPRLETVDVVTTLRPKANRGVFFPCCNTSYHGVTAVTSSGVARDFLYINISAVAGSLW